MLERVKKEKKIEGESEKENETFHSKKVVKYFLTYNNPMESISYVENTRL